MNPVFTHRSLLKTLSGLFLSLSFFSIGALASDPNTRNSNGFWYRYKSNQTWHFDLHLGVDSGPTYPGSKNSSTGLGGSLSGLYIPQENIHLFLRLGELGGSYFFSENWMFTTFFEYEQGRKSTDDDKLSGLNDIEDTVESQTTLAYRLKNHFFFMTLQPDVLNRGKGMVYFVGYGADFEISKKLRAAYRIDYSWADKTYQQTEFGISQEEANNSIFDAYSPEAGEKSFTFIFDMEYFFSSRWGLVVTAELENYTGLSAKSPLILQEGTATNSGGSLALHYFF